MRFLTIPSLLVVAGCATAAPAADGLRGGASDPAPPFSAALIATIDSVLRTPPLQRTHWGIAVRDARAGRLLYAAEPDRLFIPASNTKLVVSAVALGELGPDFRYRTVVYASGAADGGGARGAVTALRVVGSGDPTMSARFQRTPIAALDSLASQVAASGITRAGELIVDASRFDSLFVNPAWEVGDLPYTSATPVAAFAVEEGSFRLVLHPGHAVGAAGRAEVVGGAHLQPIVARVTTDTAGARPARSVDFTARRDTIHLTATIGFGAPPDTSRLSVTNPAAYAGRAFADALARQGVAVERGVRVVFDTAQARAEAAGAAWQPVAARESPALGEVVTAIQRPSQNWIAEMVLKTLGAERTGHGSWPSGISVEQRYLLEVAGLEPGSFVLRDASGLSPQNVLTPLATLRLLDHARTQPWAALYRDALPRPGLAGSTLAGRLAGLEAQVNAKTGTITNVNGLSGYLVTDAGHDLTFSILTNGSGRPAADVRRGMDRIVEAIVREARR